MLNDIPGPLLVRLVRSARQIPFVYQRAAAPGLSKELAQGATAICDGKRSECQNGLQHGCKTIVRLVRLRDAKFRYFICNGLAQIEQTTRLIFVCRAVFVQGSDSKRMAFETSGRKH